PTMAALVRDRLGSADSRPISMVESEDHLEVGTTRGGVENPLRISYRTPGRFLGEDMTAVFQGFNYDVRGSVWWRAYENSIWFEYVDLGGRATNSDVFGIEHPCRHFCDRHKLEIR